MSANLNYLIDRSFEATDIVPTKVDTEELFTAWSNCQVLMQKGSFAVATSKFKSFLLIAERVYGNDSYVVAGAYFDLADVIFTRSWTVNEGDQLTTQAWAYLMIASAILKQRENKSSCNAFNRYALLRSYEYTFRERHNSTFSPFSSGGTFSDSIYFWPYVQYIKLAEYVALRFIPSSSKINFAPISKQEMEDCYLAIIVALELLTLVEKCPVVFINEVRFLDNIIEFTKKEEEVLSYFDGDRCKLDAVLRAFHKMMPMSLKRGLVQQTTLQHNLGQRREFFMEIERCKERALQTDLNKIFKCNLPSCSKTEICIKQFPKCSRCCKVRYCGTEHQKKDWREHKLVCSPPS